MKRKTMLCFVLIFFVTLNLASTAKNVTTFLDLIDEIDALPGHSLLQLSRVKKPRRTYDNPYHPEDDMHMDSYNEDIESSGMKRAGRLSDEEGEKSMEVEAIPPPILESDVDDSST